MNFKAVAKRIIPEIVLKRLRELRSETPKSGDISRFKFSSNRPADISSDIQEKYQHRSDLLDIFAANQGCVVHKWHHYIPLYDRYFAPFRKRKIRFLEIGVSDGGSLQMWREYFGNDAVIYGIDIDPKCQQYNGLAGQVRIGSQTDKRFLESVISEMGGIDIVLDDGSHHMEHIPVSLKVLFPLLSNGGIYLIEDLHAAYWQSFGGGYNTSSNFFGFVMQLVNDMHHWYHPHGTEQESISQKCSGIHIHDSMVVIEKNEVYMPVHSRVGEVADHEKQ